MGVYSFQDVAAAIVGVGGSVNLGAGSAVAEGGITVEATGEKSTMVIGANGDGMHSLAADNSSTVTVRMLKTSAVNAILQLMYELQTASSVLHGRNVITIRDIARGDVVTLTGVAFKKRPTLTYAKEGGEIEWTFDAANTTVVLGIGIPEIL